MDNEYFTEGYTLMMEYMRKNRILTKERNFRRRLDKFYDAHKNDDFLEIEDEMEYLELEKYFYNHIQPPSNKEEQALMNFLNIITKVKTDENK